MFCKCTYVPMLLLGREAMVVIRGSKSTMDWAINFDEAVEDFQYYLSPTNYVQGQVHRGIHQVSLSYSISIQFVYPEISNILLSPRAR